MVSSEWFNVERRQIGSHAGRYQCPVAKDWWNTIRWSRWRHASNCKSTQVSWCHYWHSFLAHVNAVVKACNLETDQNCKFQFRPKTKPAETTFVRFNKSETKTKHVYKTSLWHFPILYFKPCIVCFPGIVLPREYGLLQSLHSALLASDSSFTK